MFKRYFIMIIAVLVISVAYASDSTVPDFNGKKEPVYSSA